MNSTLHLERICNTSLTFHRSVEIVGTFRVTTDKLLTSFLQAPLQAPYKSIFFGVHYPFSSIRVAGEACIFRVTPYKPIFFGVQYPFSFIKVVEEACIFMEKLTRLYLWYDFINYYTPKVIPREHGPDSPSYQACLGIC